MANRMPSVISMMKRIITKTDGLNNTSIAAMPIVSWYISNKCGHVGICEIVLGLKRRVVIKNELVEYN